MMSVSRATYTQLHRCEESLADPGGGHWRMPPPQQDPILLFSHTFLPKSANVGGRRPPPPTGNRGSATGNGPHSHTV